MSQSLDVDSLLTTPAQFDHLAANSPYRFDHATRIDRMTFMDTMSYLVDDILFKVDRASMAASLEVRCPLLDHRLIELAWRLPTAAKWSGKRGKLPLRDILYQRVPPGLLERPKMGFSAPVQIWVKNELREWAEALMSHESLSQHGLLDVPNCRKLWLDFTQYQRGWDRLIWNILMFQAWYESIKSKRKRTTSFLAVS
jgi:asparagine synthase (glutamine-hydrolysing)